MRTNFACIKYPLLLLLGAAAAHAATESFEAEPLGRWSAVNGKSTVVSERFKSGSRSLLWSPSGKGATLECRAPELFGKIVPQESFGFWVYNENPKPEILYLDFLNNGKSVGRCWYVLNFKGWRPLGAPYSQVVPAGAKIDGFRLTAPAGGKLFIDWINTACKDRLWADQQQPWVDFPEILKASAPERFIHSVDDPALNRPWLPSRVAADKVTRTQIDGMDRVAKRLLANPVVCAQVRPAADSAILAECGQKLALARQNGVVTGKPVVHLNKGRFTWGFNQPPDGVSVIDCSMLMKRLSGAYLDARKKSDKAAAKELLEMFFLLCDHIVDQGFMEGNGNVMFGVYAPAIVTLRDELAKSGRLRDMLLCAANFGIFGADPRGYLLSQGGYVADLFLIKDISRFGQYEYYGNADMIWGARGYTKQLLMTLLLPDNGERLQRMEMYLLALGKLFAMPRVGEPVALDGTWHHHPMFNANYSGASDQLLSTVLPALHGSSFAPPTTVMNALRNYLNTVALASADLSLPGNMVGYGGAPLALAALDQLANYNDFCLTAGRLDRDSAALYLALAADSKRKTNTELQRKLRAEGVKPRDLDGHLTLNSAAMAVHRRDKWMVAVAGMFKHRRGFECNSGYIGSIYNRYVRNGSIMVVASGSPVSPWSSGFRLDGWDWRLYPGATSMMTTPRETSAVNNSLSSTGGGTTLGRDGIWGMELIPADGTVSFRKSVFCFGDRVTAITTGIKTGAKAGKREVVTTLFQNAFGAGGSKLPNFGRLHAEANADVPPAAEPCVVNGRLIDAFPYENTLANPAGNWVIDNKKTGYLIHSGSAPLRLFRREQRWTYCNHTAYLRDPAKWNELRSRRRQFDEAYYKPSSGNFAVGYFEHGAAPAGAECVYTIVPQATPEKMAALKQALDGDDAPFRILRRDDAAHVFFDRPSNTTGYVVFQPSWRAKEGVLRSVNRPCFAMLRRDQSGALTLSVASTDLKSWGYTQEFQTEGELLLTLDGNWNIQGDAAGCRVESGNGKTVLHLPFRDYMPMVLKLAPKGK